MMTKLLAAGQLASQPTAPVEFPLRGPQDQALWVHVVNLSPYVFEIQDDGGLIRSVVGAFRERAVRIKVRTDRMMLAATVTVTSTPPLAAAGYAVYIDVLDQQPLMEGPLT